MFNIKNRLRESLISFGFLLEDNEVGERNKETGKKDYDDVVNALDKDKNPTAPSQVGVMKSALGIEDDEDGINRSLFGKKLRQEKNEDGSYYQFDDNELAKIRRTIKNR